MVGEAEGFPGMRSPYIKDWAVKSRVALLFLHILQCVLKRTEVSAFTNQSLALDETAKS
jgi:hypothetical protein